MFDIDHTSKLNFFNFCVVLYIYNKYVFHCIHNSHKLKHMWHITSYYEAGRKSQVFGHWNTVICPVFLSMQHLVLHVPNKIKKKSTLDTEGFNESRLVVSRTLYRAATWNLQVFSPKLERDLWRMVERFKFNKNSSIKCNEKPYLTVLAPKEKHNFDKQRTPKY